jgi:hypothetical protein
LDAVQKRVHICSCSLSLLKSSKTRKMILGFVFLAVVSAVSSSTVTMPLTDSWDANTGIPTSCCGQEMVRSYLSQTPTSFALSLANTSCTSTVSILFAKMTNVRGNDESPKKKRKKKKKNLSLFLDSTCPQR